MVKKAKFKGKPWTKLVTEYSYAGVEVYEDEYPVTKGHLIFVPHNYDEGLNYCFIRAMNIAKEKVAAREWDGYNIGINIGEAAGQTVDWPHLHLIPRRKDDCKDPAGGVRGVIPEKQNWKKFKKQLKVEDTEDDHKRRSQEFSYSY